MSILNIWLITIDVIIKHVHLCRREAKVVRYMVLSPSICSSRRNVYCFYCFFCVETGNNLHTHYTLPLYLSVFVNFMIKRPERPEHKELLWNMYSGFVTSETLLQRVLFWYPRETDRQTDRQTFHGTFCNVHGRLVSPARDRLALILKGEAKRLISSLKHL